MKIGKTIVSEREKAILESERFLDRQKKKKQKKIRVVVYFLILALTFVIGIGIFDSLMRKYQLHQLNEELNKKSIPTVNIVDEGGTGYVTEKIRDYVGKMEKAVQKEGYRVAKAIVPVNKTREVDIYIDGRKEYYKCNLDREVDDEATDLLRMIKYLNKAELTVEYVDIRVPEKAFYK